MHIEHAMQPAIEMLAVLEFFVGDVTHARHDAHAQHHVNRIRQFNPHLRERRSRWPHQIRHHIHRSPAHRSRAQRPQPVIHLRGRRPIVCRPRLFTPRCADVSRLFRARHVVGIRAMQITTGQLLLIKADQHAFHHRLVREQLLLLCRTVAPEDALRLAEFGRVTNPFQNRRVTGLHVSFVFSVSARFATRVM